MKKVTLKDSKGNEINDIMKDVLTFDCETTGLPPKGAKWDVDFAEFPNIVQLAWAVNEKERSFIIKPEGWEIPEVSIEVHGITAERANAEGVPFADIIDEFLEDCKKARLLVGHNIYFDTSIVKAMILRIMGREYYDAKAEDALFKGKRIDTMMKTIKFVGALYADGRPGKYPKLEELYKKKCALIAWIIRYVVYPVVVLMMNRAGISKKKPTRRNRETIKIKNYEQRKTKCYADSVRGKVCIIESKVIERWRVRRTL